MTEAEFTQWLKEIENDDTLLDLSIQSKKRVMAETMRRIHEHERIISKRRHIPRIAFAAAALAVVLLVVIRPFSGRQASYKWIPAGRAVISDAVESKALPTESAWLYPEKYLHISRDRAIINFETFQWTLASSGTDSAETIYKNAVMISSADQQGWELEKGQSLTVKLSAYSEVLNLNGKYLSLMRITKDGYVLTEAKKIDGQMDNFVFSLTEDGRFCLMLGEMLMEEIGKKYNEF